MNQYGFDLINLIECNIIKWSVKDTMLLTKTLSRLFYLFQNYAFSFWCSLVKEMNRLRSEINRLLSHVFNAVKEINKLRKKIDRLLTLKRLGRGALIWQPLSSCSCVFFKNVSAGERVKAWFFVAFNFIISYLS